MDLFDGAPRHQIQPAPIPWSTAPGFKSAEPWRAYCEAWGDLMAERKGEPGLSPAAILKHRGAAAIKQLEGNKRVVADDVAGRTTPRNRLFELIR